MNSLDEFLVDAKSVGIAGHVRPDGDAIGSCLATYNYVKTYYPDIDVKVFLEPIPNIFKFMARSEEIISDFTADYNFDVFFSQDCSDQGRLGDAGKYFDNAKKKVCIDHHISNKSFGEYNYIFPYASSASELVFELIPKEKITKEIAECLYTGMVHDTGVFQYSCTSKKTMEAAGFLMDLGIDYPKIVDKTFYEKTYNQNRILGQALVKSKLYLDGKVIASYITKEEMEEFDVLPKHLDGIVSQLRMTKDAEVSLFLYDLGDGEYKVSSRSASYVDVSKLAEKYGGGGHARAAGFSIKGNPEVAIEKIVKDLEKEV